MGRLSIQLDGWSYSTKAARQADWSSPIAPRMVLWRAQRAAIARGPTGSRQQMSHRIPLDPVPNND